MPNQPTLPQRSDAFAASWKRCPRSNCPDQGKRLLIEVGQHESRGDLTVEHRCLSCGFAEFGPSTPRAARKTSSTLAATLLNLRLEGVVVRLAVDDAPWPEEAW